MTLLMMPRVMGPLSVFEAFVVTLREGAELMLIMEALLSYLRSSSRSELRGFVIRGAMAGVVLGAVLAMSVVAMAAPLDPRLQALITIVFALSVVAVACGMFSSARVIRSRMQDTLDVLIESARAPLAVMGLTAFLALRETMEVVLFVHPIGLNTGGWPALQGVIFGVLGAMLLALAYRSIQSRIGLLAAFRVSAIVLSLLAIQLLLKGIGELLMFQASHAGNERFVELLSPFLEGGEWYGWLCMGLMMFPVGIMARQWWFETDR